MGRPRGRRNGRPMGRVETEVLTPEQERERDVEQWELMLEGVQTKRIKELRRTMFDAGASHYTFARSVSAGLQGGDAAWGKLWLETMGFVRAEDLKSYTLVVVQDVCLLLRPFIGQERMPEVLKALADRFGGPKNVSDARS